MLVAQPADRAPDLLPPIERSEQVLFAKQSAFDEVFTEHRQCGVCPRNAELERVGSGS